MKNNDKTKEQLLKEIDQLRGKISELGKSEIIRKKTEKALKESEKNYRNLVESLDEGIMSTDENENVTFINKAATEIFGYTKEELNKKNLKEFVSESMELIGHTEEALLRLEHNPDDMEAVATVFRGFHTIKGTAAFLGLTIISDLAQHAESLLGRVRDGSIRYSGTCANLALNSVEMLKDLIQGIEGEAL